MDHKVTSEWMFKTIGIVHSPCKEKFAIPRQSGLAPQLVSSIEILEPYDRDEAFYRLEEFSHIWVLSIFHLAQRDEWQPTVRPPRLGGNERVGVFASRSPFRPNPIGLSVFKLLDIKRKQGILYLDVAGTDLVEGTPIIDIKPYIEYADKPAGIISGYAEPVDKAKLNVQFSDEATKHCQQIESQLQIDLRSLITQLIALDPRPAYQSENNTHKPQRYGASLYNFNISFEVVDRYARIISILPNN